MTAGARKFQLVGTTSSELARIRQQAFDNWLASTETAYLECRNGRHIIPGYSDPSTSMEVRRGVCVIEASCRRCGVVMRKLVGVKDGYLQHGGRSSYDYTQADGYLLPPEACDGAAMGRDRRARVRLELLERAFRARGTSLPRQRAADARRSRKK